MGLQQLHGTLFSGPIDVVGDVHGEIDALRALLRQLGYSPHGEHNQGRRLVFLGDLCDRGPDSPAVVQLVRQMVERDLAQCLLGNHELNVLRDVRKNGNGWFFDQAHNHDHARGRFLGCKPAREDERQAIQSFFASMPLTLQRSDLRLVHAAWSPDAIAQTTDQVTRMTAHDVLAMYWLYERATEQQVQASGLRDTMEAELREWEEARKDESHSIPFLPALAQYDALYQNANPIRVLTSGVEQPVASPFYAGGKWRMVERVPWWNDYRDTVPVIMGHYWRFVDASVREQLSKGEEDLFSGLKPNQSSGPNRNVFCVDFSVGGRYKERLLGKRSPWGARLAAVRWPERELVFDEGEHYELE